jgi:small subunit ribosomal protein S6
VITIVKYDLLIMLHPEVEADRQAEILERLRATVEGAKGTVTQVDDWGKKKLSYEVNHVTDGIYVNVHFNAEPSTLVEVERVLRITEGVMRFLTVRPKAVASTPA